MAVTFLKKNAVVVYEGTAALFGLSFIAISWKQLSGFRIIGRVGHHIVSRHVATALTSTAKNCCQSLQSKRKH